MINTSKKSPKSYVGIKSSIVVDIAELMKIETTKSFNSDSMQSIVVESKRKTGRPPKVSGRGKRRNKGRRKGHYGGKGSIQQQILNNIHKTNDDQENNINNIIIHNKSLKRSLNTALNTIKCKNNKIDGLRKKLVDCRLDIDKLINEYDDNSFDNYECYKYYKNKKIAPNDTFIFGSYSKRDLILFCLKIGIVRGAPIKHIKGIIGLYANYNIHCHNDVTKGRDIIPSKAEKLLLRVLR